MRIGLLVGVFVLLCTGAVADAQTVVRGHDVTVYRQRTLLDFRDVQLEGEPDKPSEVYFVAPSRPKFRELIRLRASFSPELKKSVDQL